MYVGVNKGTVASPCVVFLGGRAPVPAGPSVFYKADPPGCGEYRKRGWRCPRHSVVSPELASTWVVVVLDVQGCVE